jgi:hypothetical protein
MKSKCKEKDWSAATPAHRKTDPLLDKTQGRGTRRKTSTQVATEQKQSEEMLAETAKQKSDPPAGPPSIRELLLEETLDVAPRLHFADPLDS